jgi:hypothetical protein
MGTDRQWRGTWQPHGDLAPVAGVSDNDIAPRAHQDAPVQCVVHKEDAVHCGFKVGGRLRSAGRLGVKLCMCLGCHRSALSQI